MGMEDFWEQLPTGKEDKPLLFEIPVITGTPRDSGTDKFLILRSAGG